MAEDIPNTPSMVQFLWEQVNSQRVRIVELEAIVKDQTALLEELDEYFEEYLTPENERWEKIRRLIHPEEFQEEET